MIHHGDNLPWLKEIADDSVTLIVCDGPYNSGRDWGEFGDEWGEPSGRDLDLCERRLLPVLDVLAAGDESTLAYLAFMAPRLQEMRRVTGAGGSTFVFCDDIAVAELRILMDAIWGRRRRAAIIAWKRTTAHNHATRNFSRVLDYILFYRGQQAPFNRQHVPYTPEYVADFFKHADGDDGGVLGAAFRLDPGCAPGDPYWTDSACAPNGPAKLDGATQPASGPWARAGHASRGYEYKGRVPPPGRKWRFSKEKMERLDAEGRLYFPPNGTSIQVKRYLSETNGRQVDCLWADIVGAGFQGERNRVKYPTSKPVRLMERIVSASSNAGDLVIDPFCGSGSSLVAAKKLDRRVAGCDVSERAVTLTRQRIDAIEPSLFQPQEANT